MTTVLGISNTHNGGIALIHNGEVKVAIQAERISRQKRQILPLGKEEGLTQECVRYCLEAADFQYKDIDAIALTSPWGDLKRISHSELFHYIGGVPDTYADTFYVPHHLSHMEYILHYGDLEPGIVLVVDGSGSLETDRPIFNVEEEHHPDIINYTDNSGKEVISAYWFDGYLW